MIEDKTMMISRVLETGSAFGHVVNTGESAFIPKAVVTATNLCEGEVVKCRVKPNTTQADTVPWFVISVHRDQRNAIDSFPDTAHVLDEISAMGMVTAEEIALAIDESERSVSAICSQLFDEGRIVQVVAYSKKGSGMTKTFYAESFEALE